MTSNTGDSHYDAAQASLRKAFGHGIQFQISYTFSRCMTDVTGVSFTAAQGGSVGWDAALNNRAIARGLCGYNRRQRLVVNYVCDLPAVNGNHGLIGQTLSGWTAAGVTTAQSGLPMTFTDTNGAAVYGLPTCGAQFCPGISFGQVLTSGPIASRLNNYVNLNAFADTSATKGWAACALPIVGAFASPSAMLEFRTEFFNAFNHPQLSNPNTVVKSAALGAITTTSTGPRILQFGLKYLF